MRIIKFIVLPILILIVVVPVFGQSTTFTEAEKESVLLMLEEEKLARDVYLAFGDKWGNKVLLNNEDAKEIQLEDVKQISNENKLNIPATVEKDIKGKFENPDLQKLYDEMVKVGSKSLIEALKIGAKIEELDIKDLSEAIANTNKSNLIRLYTQLHMASENHLRAFVRNLDEQGHVYSPVILTKARFDSIIAAQAKKVKRIAAKPERLKVIEKG